MKTIPIGNQSHHSSAVRESDREAVHVEDRVDPALLEADPYQFARHIRFEYFRHLFRL